MRAGTKADRAVLVSDRYLKNESDNDLLNGELDLRRPQGTIDKALLLFRVDLKEILVSTLTASKVQCHTLTEQSPRVIDHQFPSYIIVPCSQSNKLHHAGQKTLQCIWLWSGCESVAARICRLALCEGDFGENLSRTDTTTNVKTLPGDWLNTQPNAQPHADSLFL